MAKKNETTGAKAWLAVFKANGLLDTMGGTYRRAVESVAIVLKPRFLSGELRGWTAEDDKRMEEENNAWVKSNFKSKRKHLPPLWRIEQECRRLFLHGPSHALLVIEHSSAKARKAVEPFEWKTGLQHALRLIAEGQMAVDVLALAKRKGWVKA